MVILTVGRIIAAALFVGDHAKPFAVAVEIGLGHDDAGIGGGNLLAGGDEIVPGADRAWIDARLFVEIAAVEDGDGTGIPWHGIGDVADLKLGALEIREFRLDFGRVAEFLKIGKAIRETAPEDFSLEILDADDVRQPVAAGGAGSQRLVENLAVSKVLDGDLDIGELFVEAWNRGLQCRRGDIPAPDGEIGRLRECGAGSKQCDSCGGSQKFEAH